MRLTVDRVCFTHGANRTLQDVSFAVDDGELVSIIGPNGSGKSTLLRCIGGMYRPSAGVVGIEGKPLAAYGRRELARQIGYVPQSSREEQPFTVLDTVLMGRKPYMRWSVGKGDIAVAERILADLDLLPLASRYLNELSGGQKQKVLVARALAQQPKLLLLDEPTSALDIRHQLDLLDLLARLAKSRHCAVVLVIHELSLAARFSDRLVLLQNGRVHACGTVDEVMTAETLRNVYEVEVKTTRDEHGLHIVPFRIR